MESVKNFLLMFDKTPFAIFLTDMRGIIVDINKSSEKLFGYTKEELIGKNYLKFSNYSSEILSTFKERYKKLLKSEILDPIEIEIYKKDGIPIWVNALSMLIKLGENTYIQTIIQDITERKLLEQKSKESEEKFRTITEQSLMGIAIIQDDLIKYVNQQLRDLMGYTKEKIKKWGPGAFANAIYPEDKGLVLEQARRKQKGLNNVINHYQYRLIK
ncbi:MAG: PAS domain-containing protein, partial [Promethearchaeota archaeon]